MSDWNLTWFINTMQESIQVHEVIDHKGQRSFEDNWVRWPENVKFDYLLFILMKNL